MKSVISYTLNKCTRCMKCLKVCPTEAITIEKSRVNINHDRCINCGRCTEVCHNQGLIAKGSTVIDINSYEYTVALIPSAMYGGCKNIDEVEHLRQAIKNIGFDEVIDISDVEASVHQYSLQKAEQEGLELSSHCPVINKLISMKYPTLYSSLVKVDYPSEVAAKQVRKRLSSKINLGIFYLAECVSKLGFAKYPYGNNEFEVDHALSISDLFPLINSNLSDSKLESRLCIEGLRGAISKSKDEKGYLNIDGLEKVVSALELAEFNILDDFKYLNLNFCFNGCVGGGLLWGNAFQGKNNIKELIKVANTKPIELSEEELVGSYEITNPQSEKSMLERLERFTKVNEQLALLPEYDCGACGMAACRIMAEAIVDGNKKIEDCKVLHQKERGTGESRRIKE